VYADAECEVGSLLDNHNARMACIFHVLTWMEEQSLINSSRTVTLEMEGDTQRQYAQDTKKAAGLPDSNYDKYMMYIGRIKGFNFTGGTVGADAEFENIRFPIYPERG
jgi:hypothetical protein